MKLTADRLRELLHYDPCTGVFTRLVSLSHRTKVGDVAGVEHGNGYLRINVDAQRYFAHRLAWLYMTGSWPTGEVDHIDGARGNNRWENLRDVTRSENNQNHRAARSDSRSGLIGVIKHGPSYRARITVNRKVHLLGVFPTPQAAFGAYLDAKRRLHEAGTL